MKLHIILFSVFIAAMVGCTVISSDKIANNQANNVYLSAQKPDARCVYRGEVFGDQGNWFTGIFTSNADVILGSRNSLKNQAAKNNANYVYIEEVSNNPSLLAFGHANVVHVGQAYYCKDMKGKGVNKVTAKSCDSFSFCSRVY